MFQQFYDRQELFSIIRNTCEENEIGADIHPGLFLGNDPDSDRVLILKLDAHYHTKNMALPPPSPDYLVLVKCCNGEYEGHIVELRNVSEVKYASAKVIEKKFKTAAKFIEEDFRDVFFDNEVFRLRKLKMLLVTDPLRLKNKNLSENEIRVRMGTTALDAYGGLMPIRIGGHACQIEVKLPNPIIEPCH